MSKDISLRAGRRTAFEIVGSLMSLFRKFHAVLRGWLVRRRRRAELRRLLRAGPHLIADIGLDRDEARADCRKAPWQG